MAEDIVICGCGRPLFPILNDAGSQVGTTHTPDDDDHHMQHFGSLHVRIPGVTDRVLQESDLDPCKCGHIRGLHTDWPSGFLCSATDDVTVENDQCECSEFVRAE